MANPKRRHSKARSSIRRSHDALKEPGFSVCPKCSQRKPSHVICPNCGYYHGRQIIEV